MVVQGSLRLRFTLQKGHSVGYVPGMLGDAGEWPGDRGRRRVREALR